MTSLCSKTVQQLIGSLSLGGEAEDIGDALVARGHLDTEGHGRTARETVVLLQIDRLLGQLLHVECPEEAGDSQEDLLLGERDTRANTATGIIVGGQIDAR